MHFAYPPRKASNPPAFKPRPSRRLAGLRKSRVKNVALLGLVVVVFFFIFVRLSGNGGAGAWGGRKEVEPLGVPPVVIVTVLDVMSLSKDYVHSIRENRVKYAEKHGYKTFFAKTRDYDLMGSPSSWTKVVAMRHALTKFPDCRFIWFLDQDAFIMNPRLSLEEQVMGPSRLESLMIKDFPVVPPDSIIKTFSHLKGGDIDFVLSQDHEGLASGSLVIRNGEWAKFFLDTWGDPLYRSYNFQKAEAHALEHIVQWHPTILSKLALVPQRILNSYNASDSGEQFQDGDFVVRFPGCIMGDMINNCEKKAEPFVRQWHRAFEEA